MRFFAGLIALGLASVSSAQGLFVAPAPVDTSSLATKTEVAAVQASVPVAASSVPPMETTTTGAVGTAGTYRPASAAAPRITRAVIATTDSSGAGSVTWTTSMPTPPVVMLTPVATSNSIDCQLTSDPTATGATFRCFTTTPSVLSLSAVTAGITVGPVSTASGIKVHVLAIPTTQ